MRQHRSATIAVERAAGHHFPFGAPWVYIDGRLVGLVRERRRLEFPVPAGDHTVFVTQASHVTGAISFHLGAGDRVDVICRSNQRPLDPWHVLAVWLVGIHVALDQVGSIIPPVRILVRGYLVIPASIVLTFGLIRMLIDFHRRRALRNGSPVLWLEVITAGWSPVRPAN